MKQRFAYMTDILFAASFLAMPWAVSFIHGRAADSPAVLYRIGTVSLFLYPLACAAMLQRMALDDPLREGLRFLQGFLWRWYTWPLGVLFWAALIFHSVWMPMSFSWGEMIFGTEIHSLVSGLDAAMVWLGITALLALSLAIIARIWGVGFGAVREYCGGFALTRDDTAGSRAFKLIAWFTLGPIALLIILSLALVAPFYLYAIIWGYALSKAASGEPMTSPARDTRASRALFRAVLVLYTILLAYFFDATVGHLASRDLRGTATVPPLAATLLAMTMCYAPFRIFFALSNRRNIAGWILFALSIGFVFMETTRRFAGGK